MVSIWSVEVVFRYSGFRILDLGLRVEGLDLKLPINLANTGRILSPKYILFIKPTSLIFL